MKATHSDILEMIVSRRKADIASMGYELGCKIPEKRTRNIIPFLKSKGAILEVKRASPSKGDIAPSLDAVKTAQAYASCGAKAISVLTEQHWFKGSLNDLISVAASLTNTAVLRKDFLIDTPEVDIAFRCGADAVLLIARILSAEKMLEMVARCATLGITALVEVRLAEDVVKFKEAQKKYPETLVAGVNSRDLSDFSIDALQPAKYLHALNGRVIYESGILTEEKAAFVSSMGFHGMLLGEAAAKNPLMAGRLVSAFENAKESKAGAFWVKIAENVERKKKEMDCRPLVKICGLTQKQDAVQALKYGADLLGFICSKKSVRYITSECLEDIVRTVKSEISAEHNCPLFVGVVTELDSEEAKAAFDLAKKGVLDAVQFHNCEIPSVTDSSFSDVARYGALKIGCEGDVQKLKDEIQNGRPRILLDASVKGVEGGSGIRIPENLVKEASKIAPLWLAGGINASNVAEVIKNFHPELIDVSSGLESQPGIKSAEKMKDFFEAVGTYR